MPSWAGGESRALLEEKGVHIIHEEHGHARFDHLGGNDECEMRPHPAVRRRRQAMQFFAKLVPDLIGIEAGGTSHFWAREITAPGHEVKLTPPAEARPRV